MSFITLKKHNPDRICHIFKQIYRKQDILFYKVLIINIIAADTSFL